jgi:2-oxoglutarate ferredoxin oxidoreductase subunit beta
MSQVQDFDGYRPTWCPGCGNWGIGLALKTALVKLEYDPSSILLSVGIGCSGNSNDFINAYAMHSLHGRAIPNAIGMHLANHSLPVIVIAGDGDCYGEGGNHFLHACRANYDITVIVHDNGVYGLTTGQAAPTAQKGYKSKSTPSGIIEEPLNPLSLAITQGATFVAQTFAADMKHMVDIITQSIQHKGFSLVNILQPCVTFNKINTFQFYIKNSYKLTSDYDPNNQKKALETAMEINSFKFPLGVIYKTYKKTYKEQLPQLNQQALIKKNKVSASSLYHHFL